ncbi:hypothetical protein [Nonomuraea sp. JJY05]|uniref:hypothetical protein n=1 Tax=Nonomuraea sp. JJY05 TaxID=3350255 RepID=UPI00373EE1AB
MTERTLEVHVGSGVDSLRFGMDEPQVRAELSAYGNVVDVTAPGGALSIRAQGIDDSFSVYAGFNADGVLFTLEIWCPNDVGLIDVNLYPAIVSWTEAVDPQRVPHRSLHVLERALMTADQPDICRTCQGVIPATHPAAYTAARGRLIVANGYCQGHAPAEVRDSGHSEPVESGTSSRRSMPAVSASVPAR